MPCYKRRQNSITVESGFMPCGRDPPGGAATCCSGINNVCLTNGFCAVNGRITAGTNISAYYIGGCTDPTFSKPGCRPECSQYQDQDAVWTGSSWSCCGDTGGHVVCNPPLGPVFDDDNSPNPFLLTPIAFIQSGRVSPVSQTAAASVSVATLFATSPGTVASSGQANANANVGANAGTTSSQSFPTGAIAAIVVLAVLLALSWAVVGTWCFVHHRKSRRQVGELQPTPPVRSVTSQPSTAWTQQYNDKPSVHQLQVSAELPGHDDRRELHTGNMLN